MTAEQGGTKGIRMVFALARADNPQLYDELVKLPQGSKRVNRLRVLAYGGLLAQGAGVALSKAEPGQTAQAASQPDPAAVIQEMFAPGFSD